MVLRVNPYFDTICVHPIKSAYSLLKCVQLNSPINWNLLNFYILNLNLEHNEMFHTNSTKSLL